MNKKVLIGFPNQLLAEIDQMAFNESRTRSELVREAVRRYLAARYQDIKIESLENSIDHSSQ